MLKITIADIARQAGVSKATVSRVLNNRPEGVGAQTREKIQLILRETGFHPSAVARGLATGKSRSVGLIIPDIANPFYPLLVQGAEAVINQAGYSLFLCNSGHSVSKEKDYIRVLLEKGVDGIILDTAESDWGGQLELLDARKIPFVLLDRQIEGRASQLGVFVDNRHGASLAVSHLLQHDECSLIYINGPAELSQSISRRAGVEEIFAQKATTRQSLKILSGDDTLDGGFRLISAELAHWQSSTMPLPFNAIFACNDLMAVGALRALKQYGIRVPDQVEIIGFDDIELAQLVDPPLSTVSQPALAMGAHSAELLLDLIVGSDPPPQTRIMMPQLVLRGSTRFA